MAELSILVPARNEMFLKQTVENILAHIEGDTEILVGLDGKWADPPLIDHPRVTILYRPESIGQRAITNELCRLSKAKYVMKVDAHCAFDQGFDVKMIEAMKGHDDWTMIPMMYNLHAFNWLCKKCGKEWYQGPTPTQCHLNETQINPDCDSTEFERKMIWKPRQSRRSCFYRFDKTLHFQYWSELGRRPGNSGDIVETMSAQGSCFMLTRDKYWELDICDEKHGSWGQQGTEVACKTWLSGGRLVTNKKTWYAHMFRTQGGDFGFPYEISGKQVDHARKYSRDLFMGNTWPKAVHDLNWLLDKFKPVPDWHDGKPLKKGIVYYTRNKLNVHIARMCKKQLLKAKLPIVCVSSKPTDFGKNIVFNDKGMSAGEAIARKILTGLEALDADIVFMAEDDILYHPSHFDFTPQRDDVYYYNENVWQVRTSDGHALYYDCKKLSQLCARRDFLIKHFKERIRRIEKEGFSMGMGYEPGTHNRKERVDDFKAEGWRSPIPNIDIRHDNNVTQSRWSPEEFRNQKNCQNWKEADEVEGWGRIVFK